MPYWFYITICYLCTPVLHLLNYLPFVYAPKSMFAVFLLWRNEYQRRVVFGIAYSESGVTIGGNWKSDLANKYHNLFGIHYTKNSKYQDGSLKGDGGYLATYSNEYRSVYDFYDLCYRRRVVKPVGLIYGNQINQYPNTSYPNQFPEYVGNVVGALKYGGYFTSDLENKVVNVLDGGQSANYSNWKRSFIVAKIVTLVLIFSIIYLFVWLYRKYSGIKISLKKAIK